MRILDDVDARVDEISSFVSLARVPADITAKLATMLTRGSISIPVTVVAPALAALTRKLALPHVGSSTFPSSRTVV
jgi:hypothetical protein